MHTSFIRWGAALSAMAFCGMAEAHPGHGASYMAGLAHPLFGIDHLLAMLAVGIWAAQLGGRAMWLVPASFVTVMAAAGSLGMAGIPLPMVESGIATSVLLLGLLVAFAAKLPLALGSGLVALFAVFHGYAHGAEMPQSGLAWQYGLGFVLSTVLLHGLGLLLGRRLDSLNGMAVRILGALIASSGAWMLAVS